jgi:xanthine dehydrogenase YagR molybdenum-binding subunit
MDQLAHKLQMDPVELRLLNYADNHQTRGIPYSSKQLKASIRVGAERIGWQKPPDKDVSGSCRRGKGVALQIWGGNGSPPSYALIKMNADATFDLITGTQDIGTGVKTAITQIAAEVLGVDIGQVQVTLGDTRMCPYSIFSGGSLTTCSVGPAVKMAAEQVKEQILEIASGSLDTDAHKLDLKGGEIVDKGSSKARMPLKELASKIGNYMIVGKGARGPNPDSHNVNTFGVHFVEVEVDTATGQISILQDVAVHEFGRVINPLLVSNQMEGGVIQAIGYGVYEQRVIDRSTGKVVNPDLLDYKVPTALDVPDIETLVVDQVDSIANSIGSKGVGEPPIIPQAAALANAVFDAIGVRIRQLPIIPEVILKALMEKETGRSG